MDALWLSRMGCDHEQAALAEDRMIAATARVHGLTVATRNDTISRLSE